MEPKVFIAIPNLNWICTSLAMQFVPWTRDYGAYLFLPTGLRPPAYARNFCVKKLQKMPPEYTHIWFVDDDTTPKRPDALKLLLDADKDVISGVYRVMKMDTDGVKKPVNMVAVDAPDDEYYPVGGTGIGKITASGAGCLLIKREVFDKVPFPWFEDLPWGKTRGQDFVFCKKLAEAGIEMFAHFDVVCSHRVEDEI